MVNQALGEMRMRLEIIRRFRHLRRLNGAAMAQSQQRGTGRMANDSTSSVVARVALVGMNPVPEGMTDPRRDEYREAMKFLAGLKSAPASLFAEEPPAAPAAPCFGGNPLLDF